MDQHIIEPAEDNDARTAFEALRGEVSLLRRAIEGLTAERQAMPDYSPTLAEMNARLEAVVGWANKIAERPAMRLTPASLVDQIATASHTVREADRATLISAADRMDDRIKRIDLLVRRDQTVTAQAKTLRVVAIVGMLAGGILWSILPGMIVRSLPVGWHMPERMAAGIINADRWDAGQRMMASADPDAWRRIVAAAGPARRDVRAAPLQPAAK